MTIVWELRHFLPNPDLIMYVLEILFLFHLCVEDQFPKLKCSECEFCNRAQRQPRPVVHGAFNYFTGFIFRGNSAEHLVVTSGSLEEASLHLHRRGVQRVDEHSANMRAERQNCRSKWIYWKIKLHSLASQVIQLGISRNAMYVASTTTSSTQLSYLV